jgi:predicted XRE-type DNA-binding protein
MSFSFRRKQKDIEAAKFIDEVRRGIVEQLLEAKTRDGRISQSEVARRLDLDRSSVNRLLTGGASLTLRKLAEISWAIGVRPRVSYSIVGPRDEPLSLVASNSSMSSQSITVNKIESSGSSTGKHQSETRLYG